MQPNLVMGQMPGQMPGPQGQPRLPGQQQFFQRPMRIPRHQNPNNPPIYSSPPGGPITVQMMGPPGGPQFIPTGQSAPFMPPPVSVNCENCYLYLEQPYSLLSTRDNSV